MPLRKQQNIHYKNEKIAQNLVGAVYNPNYSEETNEIIRDLLIQRAELESTLITQINNAVNKNN